MAEVQIDLEKGRVADVKAGLIAFTQIKTDQEGGVVGESNIALSTAGFRKLIAYRKDIEEYCSQIIIEEPPEDGVTAAADEMPERTYQDDLYEKKYLNIGGPTYVSLSVFNNKTSIHVRQFIKQAKKGRGGCGTGVGGKKAGDKTAGKQVAAPTLIATKYGVTFSLDQYRELVKKQKIILQVMVGGAKTVAGAVANTQAQSEGGSTGSYVYAGGDIRETLPLDA